MLGIILCGGQSIRMGSDKGLLVYEAKTWAQTAFDKLSVINIPIKFSVNKKQQKVYEKVFANNVLIIDNAALNIHGPLLGVLSAHLQHPDDDLFLLACDLPLMKTNLLKELFALYRQNKKYDAYIFTNNEEQEPLCGIYTAAALQKISAMQQKSKLTRYSMKFVLSNLIVCEIALLENQKVYFRNFNAHADINGL